MSNLFKDSFLLSLKELIKEIIDLYQSNISEDRKVRLVTRSITRFSFDNSISYDFVNREVVKSIKEKKEKERMNILLLIDSLLLDKRHLISQREQWVVTYQISERWELKQEALSYTDNIDNSITQISEKIDALFEKLK